MGGRWAWAALALLPACATIGDSTRAAGIRREAEQRLSSCLGWSVGSQTSPLQREACRAEAKAFCRQNGLENTCAESGLWSYAPPSRP